MKEHLISFETAKLAKEKGFGLGENDYIMLPTAYELNGNLYNNGELTGSVSRKYNDSPNHLGSDTINDFETTVFIIDNSLDEFILAPTQSLLQKWLREEHNFIVNIIPSETPNGIKFTYSIHGIKLRTSIFKEEDWFFKYEQALEKGLYQALSLLTLKK